MNIQVNGKQYVWQFTYPGDEKVFSYTRMYVPVGHDGHPRHPLRRRAALLVDPGAGRQDGRAPRLHQQDLVQGHGGGRPSRASAPSSAAATTPTCSPRSSRCRSTSGRPGTTARRRRSRTPSSTRRPSASRSAEQCEGSRAPRRLDVESDSEARVGHGPRRSARPARGPPADHHGEDPSRAEGLDVVDHDDRPQEDRDPLPLDGRRLLRPRRRRGAADPPAARRAGQHAARRRRSTTSSSPCTARRWSSSSSSRCGPASPTTCCR